jgi:hypothetical protein
MLPQKLKAHANTPVRNFPWRCFKSNPLQIAAVRDTGRRPERARYSQSTFAEDALSLGHALILCGVTDDSTVSAHLSSVAIRLNLSGIGAHSPFIDASDAPRGNRLRRLPVFRASLPDGPRWRRVKT